MIDCEKLLSQPIKCRRMLGLPPTSIELLLSDLQKEISHIRELNPLSKRGRKCKLSLLQQLVLTLLYLRQYSTFLDIAIRFDISESYAQKRFVRIRDMLISIHHVEGQTELKQKIWSGDLAVDVSEQPIERPQKKQREYYSGKKKKHTIKALIVVCLATDMIITVFCGKGRKHDYKLWKEQKLKIHEATTLYADLGFQGLQKQYAKVVLPFKGSKKKPLTIQEKKANKEQSKKRISVENRNRDCKIFRITKDVYRGKHKNYGLNWNLVAGLVNFKRATTHLAA